jgi:hypothetical protein
MEDKKKKRDSAKTSVTDKSQKEEAQHLKDIVEKEEVSSEDSTIEKDCHQVSITKTKNNMNNDNGFAMSSLQDELSKVMLAKAETEMDIRRGELNVKAINAMANLEKAKLEYMKLQLEQKKMEMEDRRLVLEEIRTKADIATNIANKSLKIQHLVGKVMVGLFPAQDKQVAEIMAAAKKVSELDKE